MQITRLLFERMVNKFANNGALLDHVDTEQIKIQFVRQEFTPSLDLTLADVPVATTEVAASSILVFDAAPAEYTDVLTGDRVTEFAPKDVALVVKGVGGGSPMNIYGTRLVNNAADTLLATAHLATALQFNADAQNGGEVPRIAFRFPVNMVR